jgi:hypothetical protein
MVPKKMGKKNGYLAVAVFASDKHQAIAITSF